MPYSNEEYRNISDHLEGLLRASGFGAISEEAQSEARREIQSGEDLRDATIAYFRAVISGLGRRSRRTYGRALELMQEFVQTEQGSIIDLTLVATDGDREFLGFDEVSLSEAPDVHRLIQALEDITRDLERE